jgi:hypothetical protein
MKITGLFAASALLLAASGAAQALPAVPAAGLGALDLPITQVMGGCGFGEHRGPYGGCRLNRMNNGQLGPRAQIRRFVTGAPRGCPPGMVRGPYGGCHY